MTLRFLGPSLPFLANTGNDINDNSIAFILQYGSFLMLFTGDAGTAAERRLNHLRPDGVDYERRDPWCERSYHMRTPAIITHNPLPSHAKSASGPV